MMLIVNTNLAGTPTSLPACVSSNPPFTGFFPNGVWSIANAGGQEQHCQAITGVDNVYDFVKGHGSAFKGDEWVSIFMLTLVGLQLIYFQDYQRFLHIQEELT
jgi:hypothetical protein